jgi:3-oxoacyl-[acyl-carrier protein] reductase
MRRLTGERDAHVLRGAVQLESDQRTQRGEERERRRANELRRRNIQFRSCMPDEPGLRCASADDRRMHGRRTQTFEERESGFTFDLRNRWTKLICDGNDRGAFHSAQIGGRGKAGRRAFDRPGLLDVEGLARRNAGGAIDQANFSDIIATGKFRGQRAAKVTCADDGNDGHGTGGYSSAMIENPQLDGKVAVVTGGSRGIGRAIAAALLVRGAKVAISGRSPGSLQEAEAALKQAAVGSPAPQEPILQEPAMRDADRVFAVRANVAKEQEAADLISRTVERFGGLDILINNAGVGGFANVADMSTEDWRTVMETNVYGVFFCSRAALPHLKRRGGGWIISISSLASKNAVVGGAAYCASKAALNAFSEALMLESRYDDIRVSTVLPGSVATGFSSSETSGAKWKLSPDDVAQVVIDLLGHPGRSLPSRVELRPSKPPKRS